MERKHAVEVNRSGMIGIGSRLKSPKWWEKHGLEAAAKANLTPDEIEDYKKFIEWAAGRKLNFKEPEKMPDWAVVYDGGGVVGVVSEASPYVLCGRTAWYLHGDYVRRVVYSHPGTGTVPLDEQRIARIEPWDDAKHCKPKLCSATHPQFGCLCGLSRNHSGYHEYHDNAGRLSARWPQESESC